MTCSISMPLQFGDQRIAVISITKTTSNDRMGSSAFVCQKQPVYVLWRHDKQVTALDMFGDTVPVETIAAHYPKELEDFLKPT